MRENTGYSLTDGASDKTLFYTILQPLQPILHGRVHGIFSLLIRTCRLVKIRILQSIVVVFLHPFRVSYPKALLNRTKLPIHFVAPTHSHVNRLLCQKNGNGNTDLDEDRPIMGSILHHLRSTKNACRLYRTGICHLSNMGNC